MLNAYIYHAHSFRLVVDNKTQEKIQGFLRMHTLCSKSRSLTFTSYRAYRLYLVKIFCGLVGILKASLILILCENKSQSLIFELA